jgi:carboxylesterase type B
MRPIEKREGGQVVEGSEDCLYLNVYRPAAG